MIFALEMDVWNITVSGQLLLLSWWCWLAEVLFLGGRFLNGGSVCSLGGNLSLCYGCGRFSLVAPVCVNFDFLTCSFILSPWRNKRWVSCCDCFMLPDAQASLVRSWIPWRLVNSLLGWVMLPSVVRRIQRSLAPNQNGMARLGNLRVGRPLTTRPGMWLRVTPWLQSLWRKRKVARPVLCLWRLQTRLMCVMLTRALLFLREWQISKYGVRQSLWWTSLQIWIGLSQSSLQLVREMQRLHATSHGLLALTPHLPSKIRRTKRKILVCLPGLAAGNPRQRVIKGRPSESLLDYGNFW